jgi:hypothetical protein
MRAWRTAVVIFQGLLLFAQACTSRHAQETRTSDKQAANTARAIERQFDGGSYCIQTIINGPAVTTPLHFSYKQDSSDGTSKDYEADLAGDKFDLKIQTRHPATDLDRELNAVPGAKAVPVQDGFADSLQTNHYKRSNPHDWALAANLMVTEAAPWQLFIAKPEVTQVGAEDVSGYETLRYTVDTSRQSPTDKAAAIAGWNLKDYNITGSVWATKDTGCILQYAINLEKTNKDGKVDRTHYQGAVTKG